MTRLDNILKYLQQNQRPQQQRPYHDPAKVAAIMQQLRPGWQYTDTELAAIDALFNTDKWVLLTGNMGTGKTTLLHLFQQVAHIIDRQQCEMMTANKLCLMFGKSGESVILQYESGLLLLDDIGAETPVQNRYGTLSDPVSTLLFLRYEAKARTICTTNLDVSALKKRYGDRLADRFREVFTVIPFTGKSKR